MTKQDCKNEVAKKYGFSAWELGENAMLTHISNEKLLSKRWEEAMQLYADAAYNQAIRDVVKQLEPLFKYAEQAYKKNTQSSNEN